MVTKSGIYAKTQDDRCSVLYNGQEVDSKMFGAIKKTGLYISGQRLYLYGCCIAQSASLMPSLYEKDGALKFGEVDLLTSGRCINISLSDYNKLLSGEGVDGYKAYSVNDVYNVIPDGGTAEELTYTKSNGVYTFSNGITASVGNNIVYNNVSDLPVNTEDLTETIMNTDCPQIYVRYFDPIIPVGGTIELEYHVDDITMSALNYDKVEDTFTTIIKTESGSTVTKTTYAGMFKITTPAFSNAGETWFSIRCIDSNGVASIEQFFDILVRNPVTSNYYTMQVSDLETYGIVPNDGTISVAFANKAALSNFFAAVKNNGYNGVKMLNNTYWIDYHATFGTQRYFKCTISANKVTAVEELSYQDIISLGVYTHTATKVPSINDKCETSSQYYYYVINTSTNGANIVFPNSFTVDLNGATFRVTQSDDLSSGDIFCLDNNFDTHIINGNIVGSYDGFDFYHTAVKTGRGNPAEWMSACSMKRSRYCTFENLDVSETMGYDGLFNAVATNYGRWLTQAGMVDGKRIDLTTGEAINAENMVLSGSFPVSDNELIAFGRNGNNKYLHMGTKRELFFSFYAANGDYIKTIKGHAYRLLRTPFGARTMRITGYGVMSAVDKDGYATSADNTWGALTKNGQLMLFRPQLCINVATKNCNWHHTRTIALGNASASGCLIENCTYSDIAVKEGHEVTPALGDYEDSWNWGFNLAIRNCSCTKGSGYDNLIFYYMVGVDFTGNSGISITDYGGIEKGYIHNNTIPTLKIQRNRSCYNPFVIYDNNAITTLDAQYGVFGVGNTAVGWNNGYAERVVSMTNSVIANKSLYNNLKLRNSKNGNDVFN